MAAKDQKTAYTPFPEQVYSLDELEQLLTSFKVCTGLHVHLADNGGNVLLAVGDPAPYCTAVTEILQTEEPCRQERLLANRQAGTMGSAYFYTCHAGACNIAFPIVNRRQQYGVVIAGPFLLEEPDAAMTRPLQQKHRLSGHAPERLAACAQKIPVISPVHATQISNLLSYLVGGYLRGTREMMRAGSERLLQQSRISEALQNYKNLTPAAQKSYPIQLENTLLARTRRADTTGARLALNDLLGFLLLYESYEIDKLKIRVIELCALLSRAAIERDGDAERILDLNEKLIREINETGDFNEICYILSDNIDVFTEQFIESDQHHSAITHAIRYLSVHYSEPVTLAGAARSAGVHPSYLSSLFRKVTGLTFKDYLNQIRIEHALELLKNTDYPIMEIAISCGFNDQSYFTKVFKKQTGMTPRQFR
ncbi:MAG: PocR ligand-binding domain-containing protein [Eubacterium sp.]|nr:PocR ligand-binding domain-containing protein [Eubacterium sp.]